MKNETFDWNNRDTLFVEVAHYVVERQGSKYFTTIKAIMTRAICRKCVTTKRIVFCLSIWSFICIIGGINYD